MTTELGFLQAILTEPGDDAHRLVYADWLDERDDPRGRYLRLEVRLAGLVEQDPAYAALEAELRGLHADLEPAWRAAVGKRYDFLLESYPLAYKIHTIKLISALSHLGLKEAKDLSEALPAIIPIRGCTREDLLHIRPKFAAGTRVTPHAAADSASAALEVQLRALSNGFRPEWLPGADRRYDLVLEESSMWGSVNVVRAQRQWSAQSGGNATPDWNRERAEAEALCTCLPCVLLTDLPRVEALQRWGRIHGFATVSLRESAPAPPPATGGPAPAGHPRRSRRRGRSP